MLLFLYGRSVMIRHLKYCMYVCMYVHITILYNEYNDITNDVVELCERPVSQNVSYVLGIKHQIDRLLIYLTRKSFPSFVVASTDTY